MASFGIGEVEELLGLPASTLRHWERVLPLLEPRKDAFGRRVYSESDLRLLLRLKHLAQGRGLGIGAAGDALVAELAAANPETRARLAELRGDLIGLYFQSRASGRELGRRLAPGRAAGQPAAGQPAAGQPAEQSAAGRAEAPMDARRGGEAETEPRPGGGLPRAPTEAPPPQPSEALSPPPPPTTAPPPSPLEG